MLTVKNLSASELNGSLLDAWRAVQIENPQLQHPLLSPEYSLAVADVRQDVEVAVLVDGTQSVGFLPYHRNSNNVAVPIADEVSDFHSVVIAPDLEWEPEKLLRDLGLVAFNFHHLPVFQKEFVPYHCDIDPAYYLDIEDGFEEYVARRKSSG